MVKRKKVKDISIRTVERLPEYLSILKDLLKKQSTINSEDLANKMNTTAAQVRKDLSSFGEFGTRGKGYDIKELANIIEDILGINTVNKLILIGYGNMGHMISSNKDVLGKGFSIEAVFDGDERKSGMCVLDTDLTVLYVDKMKDFIKNNGIQTAILSVTSSSAQNVANELIEFGIRAILNLTTTKLSVPENISVVNVDISAKLQELNFWKNHLKKKF